MTKMTSEQSQELRRRHLEVQEEKRRILGEMLASDYADPEIERTSSNCNTNWQLSLFGLFLLSVVLFSHFSRLPPPLPEIGQKFLEKNRYKDGVRATKSGLQYKILKKGYGARPSVNSKVKVDYEGRLLSGVVFDSSFERGTPMSFEVNRVVNGWTEGLQLMREGSEFELYLPPELGYGDQYRGKFIYPHAVLIFKVNLLEVQTNSL
jgi:hypothetical protein|tara:strand:+ start:42 stop:662 length:621 start_codon:yes stop_codon:yes gene_type:complete